MAVRERTHEYGVLRAIGFLPRQILLACSASRSPSPLLGGGLGLLSRIHW